MSKLPCVRTTREDLHFFGEIQFDDMWHDFMIAGFGNKPGAVRLLEFGCIDVHSGFMLPPLLKPRLIDTSAGTMKNLNTADFRFFLASVFTQYGYNPKGTVLTVEHGTAAISKELEGFLSDISGGAITVNRGGISGQGAFIGAYEERGKGNPRAKSSKEGIGKLIHNALATLPGQVGTGIEARPASLHGRLKEYSALMKAVEAGADVIDTAVSCFSGGTSQPPTETLVYALREMGYEISVKDDVVKKINDFFKPIRAKYLANGLLNPVVMGNATDALIYQVPGGMLSNLVAQLTAQKALDKLDAVLLEVPKVRKDLGYPPLVTPMSQMVGVQATVNVLTGGRYKNVSKEIKAYVKGEYGRAPGKIDPEVQKLVLGDEKPITQRYADLLEPGFEKAKRELGERAHSDEDVLSYIAFPAQAEAYFEKRDRKEDDNEIHFSIREVK